MNRNMGDTQPAPPLLGVGRARGRATILALDIGTSSTRAVLYDAATGDALPGATEAVPHEPDATADGGSTLDPDAVVREAVDCARAALAKGDVTGGVAAVAVCTFWHSIVGVDRDGRALTPILLWSDRRSAPQVQALAEAMDAAAYTQRTGCRLHTSYVPARLRWLAETDPATFRQCARFVSPAEYLFGALLGPDRAACSVSMASASGLMDQARGGWDPLTLAHLPGLSPTHLTPISDEPVSGLRAPYRALLPALADIPWFPAFGDGACSNIGCGATRPDRLALMIGTSGALRVVAGSAPPTVPTGLWRYQADARRYLVGGALSNGGNVWGWLQDTLRLPDAPLSIPAPDSHGLTVLPFLNGERAPGWRDDARAVIAGLSAATTPADIAQAHLEAVAYRFAAVRERLRAAAPSAEIIGTGAGLKASPAWTQILADVLEEPILVSAEEQASSRGAVLLTRERLGLGAVDSARFPTEARFAPNPARAARYLAARARHEALYQQMLGEDAPY